MKLIVDSGVADVNLQNKAGYTPIMLAALADVQTEDDRIAIQLLLSRGNVNLAASQVWFFSPMSYNKIFKQSRY